jgi:methylenetetrahydrofolate dehydrogenase (NADP+)/methenyltetrahydrofolate cyclohydrolase
MAKILDGRALAREIRKQVKGDVGKLSHYGIKVGLGILQVGKNPASEQYFQATLKACNNVDISPYTFTLSDKASVNEILNVVNTCNTDERINGLLVLFPLPRTINARRVVNEISTEKDIDGLGAMSVGRLAADESSFQLFKEGSYELLHECRFLPTASSFLPCTPFGVIRLMEHHNIGLRGKHAVVVGKSLAVGKPLAHMLLAKEATITVCHKETHDLGHFIRQADIICSATGVPGLIKGDMVKEGAVVVDIGINVLENGKIVGDIDFEAVEKKASFITPVPGGVGPVTISMLLENTLRSAQRNEMLKSPLMAG